MIGGSNAGRFWEFFSSSPRPDMQWVPGALCLGVKRLGREAGHSPPHSAEVKNEWSYTSTPPVSLHGVVLSESTGTTLPLPHGDITSIHMVFSFLIGVLGFDSWQGLGIFLFTTASRTALGTTQPPIQWVPGSLSLGVRLPEREADHSPPSSAEVKE
jgi:hypothetical protein